MWSSTYISWEGSQRSYSCCTKLSEGYKQISQETWWNKRSLRSRNVFIWQLENHNRETSLSPLDWTAAGMFLPWERQVLHNDTHNISKQLEELAISKKNKKLSRETLITNTDNIRRRKTGCEYNQAERPLSWSFEGSRARTRSQPSPLKHTQKHTSPSQLANTQYLQRLNRLHLKSIYWQCKCKVQYSACHCNIHVQCT